MTSDPKNDPEFIELKRKSGDLFAALDVLPEDSEARKILVPHAVQAYSDCVRYLVAHKGSKLVYDNQKG